MIIRNDDVAADTTLEGIRALCEICDRYGARIIHAITAIGNIQPIQASMSNEEIRRVTGPGLFIDNQRVAEYLQGRPDAFAVHGLWHTHGPTEAQISAAQTLIERWLALKVQYFVPPFNEGEYGESVCGLKVIGAGIPRLEEYLAEGDPKAPIVYLHSWRFERGPFNWPMLDKCLARLTARS